MADDEWNDDAIDIEEGEVGPSDNDRTDEDEDDAEGWRFSLDDLEDDGNDDADEEADGFSLYGEIEAGSPSVENALFVGLGLALGLIVFASLFL